MANSIDIFVVHLLQVVLRMFTSFRRSLRDCDHFESVIRFKTGCIYVSEYSHKLNLNPNEINGTICMLKVEHEHEDFAEIGPDTKK